MHWAARAGILLRHGVSADALNAAQRTFLQMAADRDQIEMVRLLSLVWRRAEYAGQGGQALLHRATFGGLVDTAETLLELGAGASILNKKGENPFEIARKESKYLKKRPVG